MKEYFTKYPPFINRIAEKEYILGYLNSSPANIMFIYGPKSTGKTTLVYKIVNEEINKKEYDIKFINLRDYLINEFKDFRNIFFPLDLKKGILKGVLKNKILGFDWDDNDLNMLKSNIFGLLKKKIIELNKNGIKPVIILDEFQYLKDIYIDDKKEIKLVDELFKFFISITKQFNLAHVICLTSDSYYLEELYNDTKLTQTSRFYLMQHLNKDDIYGWLKSEKCPEKMIKDIWKNLGGSVWEIWQVLVGYKNTGDYKETLDDLIQTKYGLVGELYVLLDKKDQKNFEKIIKELVKKGSYELGLKKEYNKLIKKLVANDIWFYDSKRRIISSNSKSFEIVFKRVLKELKEI